MQRNRKVESSFWQGWFGRALSIAIKGFIVIGLIAAVVGVVLPKAGAVLDQGNVGAKMSERSVVQKTLLVMMATRGITKVDGMTGKDASINSWESLPAGIRAAPLADYLDDASSVYFYCFNSRGVITQQDVAPSPCPESD